jgi:hypothetical protein
MVLKIDPVLLVYYQLSHPSYSFVVLRNVKIFPPVKHLWIPLQLISKDSRLQGFKDSRLQGFKDSSLQGFDFLFRKSNYGLLSCLDMDFYGYWHGWLELLCLLVIHCLGSSSFEELLH